MLRMSAEHERNKKNSFWDFGWGNVIAIVVNVIGLAYFVGVNAQILKQHAAAIESTQLEIKAIKQELRDITVYGTTVDKTLQLATTALDAKIARIEIPLSKIELLANDMEWLKKWLADHIAEPKS